MVKIFLADDHEMVRQGIRTLLEREADIRVTAEGGTGKETLSRLPVVKPDLLILDQDNVLWRWRPADAKGRGTVIQIKVRESSSWGNDIVAIGTFCRTADCALYNLYVVDPSQKQILTYSPAADGSGYPAAPTGRLATARDVSQFPQMYIDGDIYTLTSSGVTRYQSGQSTTFALDAPPDDADVRPGHDYRALAATGARGEEAASVSVRGCRCRAALSSTRAGAGFRAGAGSRSRRSRRRETGGSPGWRR